jgi:hypothetical protein
VSSRSGENTQIKLKQKNGETLWTLPYPSGEAEIVLNEDVDMVKLELAELSPQIRHADPLLGVGAGVHTIGVSGNAPSPFQVDSTIPALCYPKGEKH